MDLNLRITCDGLDLAAELRSVIEQKASSLSSRFGPARGISIGIKKRFLGVDAVAEVELAAWRLTCEGTGLDAAAAVEDLFVRLSGLARGAAWAQGGISKQCRWCQGQHFVHAMRTRDRTEGDTSEPAFLLKVGHAWKGALEALVCTNCGCVEWFVSDPQSLPVGDEWGTTEVKTRQGPPYR